MKSTLLTYEELRNKLRKLVEKFIEISLSQPPRFSSGRDNDVILRKGLRHLKKHFRDGDN